MSEQNLAICVWKLIANRDLEKKAEGRKNITLGEDSLCYKCDGTKQAGDGIGCKYYREKKQ